MPDPHEMLLGRLIISSVVALIVAIAAAWADYGIVTVVVVYALTGSVVLAILAAWPHPRR